MSRWFRHYTGMARDEKLVAVAVRAKQPVERVIWVWNAILESASEIDDGGRFEFDAGEAAYFLRTDEADLAAIVAALANADRLSGNTVVNWGDRQYQSDTSRARQAAYRERKRAKNRHGDVDDEESDGEVTSRDGEVTPQETDTDTEPQEKPTVLPVVSARDKRGTRMPLGFTPIPNVIEDAHNLGFTEPEIIDQLERMRDWALATTGQKGLKRDWNAFARNWFRRSADERKDRQRHAKPPSNAIIDKFLNG